MCPSRHQQPHHSRRFQQQKLEEEDVEQQQRQQSKLQLQEPEQQQEEEEEEEQLVRALQRTNIHLWKYQAGATRGSARNARAMQYACNDVLSNEMR